MFGKTDSKFGNVRVKKIYIYISYDILYYYICIYNIFCTLLHGFFRETWRVIKFHCLESYLNFDSNGDIKHAEIQHVKAKPLRPESAPRPRRLTRRQHAGGWLNGGVGLEDDILTKMICI